MQVRIGRVNVMSIAKIYAAVLGTFGLVIGLIVAFVSLVGGMAGAGSDDGAGVMALMGGLGLFSVILFPLFYALVGLVVGAFFAFLYNLYAGRLGGVELRLDHLDETGG
jgi:hypothetical protein